MTGPIEVDASDFRRLAADLAKAGKSISELVRPVVQRGALNIKNEWRDRAKRSAGAHGRHYPYSIRYDTRETASGSSAEIGPDSSKSQGSMGRGFEFGSIRQPPHLDFLAAAMSEEPRFVKSLADILGGVL